MRRGLSADRRKAWRFVCANEGGAGRSTTPPLQVAFAHARAKRCAGGEHEGNYPPYSNRLSVLRGDFTQRLLEYLGGLPALDQVAAVDDHRRHRVDALV